MSTAYVDPPRPRGVVGIYEYQRRLRKLQGILDQEAIRLAERLDYIKEHPASRMRTFYRRVDAAMDEMLDAARHHYDPGGAFYEVYAAGLNYGNPGSVLEPGDLRILRREAREGIEEAERTASFAKRDARSLVRELKKNDIQTSRQARKYVQNRGISGAVYSNGHRFRAEAHATMQARTRAQKAYNVGTIKGASRAGVTAWEIKDGPLCGMTSHDDPEKADGQIVNEKDAMVHLIAHPACQRIFVPRADIKEPPGLKDALRHAFEKVWLPTGKQVAAGGAITFAGATVGSLLLNPNTRVELIKAAVQLNPQHMRFTANIEHLVATFSRDNNGNLVQLSSGEAVSITAEQLREEVSAYGEYLAFGRLDDIPDHVKFILTGSIHASKDRLIHQMEQFEIFAELHRRANLDDEGYRFKTMFELDIFERFRDEVLPPLDRASAELADGAKFRFTAPRIRGKFRPRMTADWGIIKFRSTVVNRVDYLRREAIPDFMANRHLILNRKDLEMIARENGIDPEGKPTLMLMAQLREMGAEPGLINTEKLRVMSPQSLVDYAKSGGITHVNQFVPGHDVVKVIDLEDATRDDLVLELRQRLRSKYMRLPDETGMDLRSVGGRFDIEDLAKKSRQEILDALDGEGVDTTQFQGMMRGEILSSLKRRNRAQFSALSNDELLAVAREHGVYFGDHFSREGRILQPVQRALTPIQPGSVIVSVEKASKEQMFEALVEWMDLPGEVSRYTARQLRDLARQNSITNFIIKELPDSVAPHKVVKRKVASVLPDNPELIRRINRLRDQESVQEYMVRKYSFIKNPGELATRRQVVTALGDLRRVEMDKMKLKTSSELRRILRDDFGVDSLEVVRQGPDEMISVPVESAKREAVIRALDAWDKGFWFGHGLMNRVSVNPGRLLRLGLSMDPAGRILPNMTARLPGPMSFVRWHTEINEAGSISTQLRFLTRPIPVLREVKINFNNHRLINITAELRILGWTPFGIARTLKITPEQAIELVRVVERKYKDVLERVRGSLATRFNHTMSMLHIQRRNVVALNPEGRMGDVVGLVRGDVTGQVQRFHGVDLSDVEGEVPEEMLADMDRAIQGFHEAYPGLRLDGIRVMMSDDITLVHPMQVIGNSMSNRDEIKIVISRNIARNYGKYKARLEEGVRNGWHPALMNPSPVSQMTHELSHLLDMSLTPNERIELMQRISEAGPAAGRTWRTSWETALRNSPDDPGHYFVAKNRKNVALFLSRYSATRKTNADVEFFADSLTEYWNSPDPRNPARITGEYMDELFGDGGKISRTDTRWLHSENPRPFDPLYRYTRKKLPTPEDWEEVRGWGRRERGFASRVRRLRPGDEGHPWTGRRKPEVPDTSEKKPTPLLEQKPSAREVHREGPSAQPKPPTPPPLKRIDPRRASDLGDTGGTLIRPSRALRNAQRRAGVPQEPMVEVEGSSTRLADWLTDMDEESLVAFKEEVFAEILDKADDEISLESLSAANRLLDDLLAAPKRAEQQMHPSQWRRIFQGFNKQVSANDVQMITDQGYVHLAVKHVGDNGIAHTVTARIPAKRTYKSRGSFIGDLREIASERAGGRDWTQDEINSIAEWVTDHDELLQGVEDKYPGLRHQNLIFKTSHRRPGNPAESTWRNIYEAAIDVDLEEAVHWTGSESQTIWRQVQKEVDIGYWSPVPTEVLKYHTDMHEIGHHIYWQIDNYTRVLEETYRPLPIGWRRRLMEDFPDPNSSEYLAEKKRLEKIWEQTSKPLLEEASDLPDGWYYPKAELARRLHTEMQKEIPGLTVGDVEDWINGHAPAGSTLGNKISRWAINNVSGYAGESFEEFYAEAFSEVTLSANPRPVAKIIGDWTDELVGHGGLMDDERLTGSLMDAAAISPHTASVPRKALIRTSFEPTKANRFQRMLGEIQDEDPYELSFTSSEFPAAKWWGIHMTDRNGYERSMNFADFKWGNNRFTSEDIIRGQNMANDTMAMQQGLLRRFPGWKQRQLDYISFRPASIPGTYGHTMNRASDWAEVVIDENVAKNWGLTAHVGGKRLPDTVQATRELGWFTPGSADDAFAYVHVHETGHQLFFTVQRYAYLKQQYLNDITNLSDRGMFGIPSSKKARLIAELREQAEWQLRELGPTKPADPMDDLYERIAKAINEELRRKGVTDPEEFVTAEDVKLYAERTAGGEFKGGRAGAQRTIIVQKHLQKELSFYGSTQMHETMAEGFAEYMLNPKPRPVAREIGEWFEDYLGPGSVLARKNITPETLWMPPGISRRYFLDLEDDAPGAIRRMLDNAKDTDFVRATEAYIESAAGRFETTVKEVKDFIDEELRSYLTPETRIVILSRQGSIEQIIQEGRIKNAAEINDEVRMSDERIAAEKYLFGIPEDASPSDRPIYGFVRSGGNGLYISENDLDYYGDHEIILKQSVKDRATVTLSDSFFASEYDQGPTPINNPRWFDIGRPNFFNDHLQHGTYIEAQIHGGLSVDDIDQVNLPSDEILRDRAESRGRSLSDNAIEQLFEQYKRERQEFAEYLERHGIRWSLTDNMYDDYDNYA